MPVASPDIVADVPVPVVTVPSGVMVKVHVPVAGNSFNVTLPVASVHVGWVIVPTVGDAGVDGCALMTMLADADEMHPDALVTVKVYVLAASPEIVELDPVPE